MFNLRNARLVAYDVVVVILRMGSSRHHVHEDSQPSAFSAPSLRPQLILQMPLLVDLVAVGVAQQHQLARLGNRQALRVTAARAPGGACHKFDGVGAGAVRSDCVCALDRSLAGGLCLLTTGD